MREELIAFLAGAKGPVRIGPRSCSRCGEPRDIEDQRYCAHCRREYRQEHQKAPHRRVTFHGRFPELSAFFFLQKSKIKRHGKPLDGLAASIRSLPEWPVIARECAAIRFPEEVSIEKF